MADDPIDLGGQKYICYTNLCGNRSIYKEHLITESFRYVFEGKKDNVLSVIFSMDLGNVAIFSSIIDYEWKPTCSSNLT